MILLVVILVIAPSTISKTSFSAVLPFTTFLAIAALGQMLVIMTGGIDLSVPGVMTLAAFITVGVGGLRAYESAELPADIVVTFRTDEFGFFCEWAKSG